MNYLLVFIVILSSVLLVQSLSFGLPSTARGIIRSRKVSLYQNSNLLVRGGKKKAHKSTRRNKAAEKEPELPVDDTDATSEPEEESEDESTDNDYPGKSFVSALASKLQFKALMKAPPITQFYVGSSIVVTSLSYLFNNNKWPEILSFSWKGILLKLQIWRLFTSFLSFGPFDLFFPLNLSYLWQHMSQLERLSCKKPEEFFTMLMFGSISLVVVYSLLGMPMKFLGHNLASFLVYIWSRAFEGHDVSFLEIITLKAEMIPWFFCLQTLIMERDIPVADLIGIAVGHLYLYLNQKKMIPIPAMVSQWFATGAIRRKYDNIRQDFV